MITVFNFLVISTLITLVEPGILYPRASESREVLSLDGIWKFKKSHPNRPNIGFDKRWFSKDLEGAITMPVPSSYNDITADPQLRDFVGWAWYQKRFFPPIGWKTSRVYIRFGSVCYSTRVYLNGKLVGKHAGGHLPFKFEITQLLTLKEENLLTVVVNNTLTRLTIPQGDTLMTNDTSRYPPGYKIYNHAFDYFNYAGIHRPVFLYTVPQVHIEDITTRTYIDGSAGIVQYTLLSSTPSNGETELLYLVSVLDHNGIEVATNQGQRGTLHIHNATFWWPRLSDQEPGYLYTLQVKLLTSNEEDIYRLPLGIRTLQWNATSFFLNGKPIYLRGFGRHEDLPIIGRGLDTPALIRDFNLMRWLGANAFRTSHYPYSEELMDLADQQGFMVILESPACSLKFFGPKLLEVHLKIIEDMVQRDKNRPSVIMWSLANEPLSNNPKAEKYFSALVNRTKELDPTRPVTFVTSQSPETDKAVQFVDVICINRYPSWYSDGGKIDLIQYQVQRELSEWYRIFNKPVIVTEYGAGSVPGLHMLPAALWSEEYHIEVLQEHFKIFDVLRMSTEFEVHGIDKDKYSRFLVGEMIWNFADFATEQEIIRPGLCMKGLFTRNRQPKMAAHVARKRFWSLAAKLGNRQC